MIEANQCAHCHKPLTRQSLTAEGEYWACPCGRTTWTILTEGQLDLGPSAAPVLDPDEVGKP